MLLVFPFLYHRERSVCRNKVVFNLFTLPYNTICCGLHSVIRMAFMTKLIISFAGLFCCSASSISFTLHLPFSLSLCLSLPAAAAAMRQVAARTLHQLVSNLLWTGKNGDARQDKSRRPFMSCWLDSGDGGEGQTLRGRKRSALSLQSFVNYVFACSANVAFPPQAQRMAKTKAISLSRPGAESRVSSGGMVGGGWGGQTFAWTSAGQSRTRLAGSLR